MPVKVKQMRVAFYALEPAPPFGEQKSFPFGGYPLVDIVSRVGEMDRASEEYRLPETMWGGETLCVFHDDGPQPLLGAYYRDNWAKALTEFKGEIEELPLRDGEALVDASFAAFFPGDVVGLVRTSNKSPRSAKIAQWLTCVGGYACALIPLRDLDTWTQLEARSTHLTRFNLRARRDRLREIEARATPGVARTLRAAADVNVSTEEIGLEWRATRGRKDRALWSRQMQHEIHELLSVLPEFEEAKVRVSGQPQAIDLNRSDVQHTVTVPLYDTKRLGPREAASAIFEAYELERPSIEASLAASRRDPDEWETTPNSRPVD